MAIILPDVELAKPLVLAEEINLSSKNGFVYILIMNGKNIQNIGYNQFLYSIILDQDIDKIDKLTLEFINLNRTDDEIFSEGIEIELSLGYASSRLVSFGKFKSQKPQFRFNLNGYSVSIIAYSISMNMSISHQRNIYSGKRHSDICKEIILKYSFDGDIQETNDIYESIIQTNETDYSFLKKLADLNGYLFFLRNNVIHFHGIRVGSSPDDNTNIILDFLNTTNNIILESKVEIYHINKRKEIKRTMLDRATGLYNELSVSSQVNLDGTLDVIETNDIKKSLLAEQSVFYDTKSGISNSVNELQKRLNAYSSYSDFIIKLKMKTIGIEDIVVGKLINIERLNRFSGIYYISKVIHKLSIEEGDFGYTTYFTCWKKFIGKEQDAQALNTSYIDFLNENQNLFDVTDSSQIENQIQLI